MWQYLKDMLSPSQPGAPENMDEITEVDDLQRLLETSNDRPVVLFKHSTRCPISSAALREYESFAEQHGKQVHCAYVDLVAHRDVSNAVARTLGVSHQSPQAILLADEQAVWDTSHGGITRPALEQAAASRM